MTNLSVGQSYFLDGNMCAATDSVIWSNGMTGRRINLVATVTKVFYAYCQNSRCTGEVSAPVTITVNGIEALEVSADKNTICAGQTVNLKANGCFGQVNWSNGLVGSNISTIFNISTPISAICVENGVPVSESNIIDIKVVATLSTPYIQSDIQYIKQGSSVFLTASYCSNTVKWSNGQVGAKIEVSPNVTTNYRAICENGTCKGDSSNRITINVLNTNYFTLSADKDSVCTRDIVSIAATGCNNTVEWSDGTIGSGGATQWKFLNVDKVTKISVLCRDGINIIGVSNQLTVKPKNSWIKPVITSQNITFCTQDKVLLTATGCDYKIKWSPYGLIGKDSTFKMDLSAGNQQIYARCQSQDGCLSAASDTMNVKVYKSPAAPYAMGPPNDGTFPKGSIVTLNVNSVPDPYSPLGAIVWYVKRPNGTYIDTITAQNTINYTLNETVIIEVASKTRTCENRRVVNQYIVDNTTNIACYTLNGNAQDGSGRSRHGEIVGNVISTTDRFNNPNGALYFPGNANSWVKVIPPFYVGPSLTINVWINRELGSSDYVLGQGRRDLMQSWFGIVCGDANWGKPGFGVKYGGFNPDISYAYSNENLQNNTWYMLTGILDVPNDKIKFYVNGVKKGEANYPYKNSISSQFGFPFAIGRNTAYAYDLDTYGTWETYPYKGKINDLCMFNRAMSDAEVATMYNSGTCPQIYSINSGSWDNPSTWSCNRVPIFSDIVVISTGNIVAVPNGTFHAKTVIQNGNLNFQPLGEIKIYGN